MLMQQGRITRMTEETQAKATTVWSMIGHEWAVEHLQAHIARGQVRHAYLFTGPDGVGRRTLALRFAQALNCTQPPAPGEYCGECRECRQLARMEHPDLSVVAPEEPSNTIKVDQIRLLQRGIYLAPYQTHYRMALLLDFEQANPNAANALLKTLEEPPSRVILLLTASDSESLLPTVASRCEIIRLQPVPTGALEKKLQSQWGIDPESAGLYAHISGGRPGYASRFAHDSEALSLYQSRLDDHRRLLSASRAIRFGYAEEMDQLAKQGGDMREVLQTWLNLWRDVLLRASGAKSPLTNPDRLNEIDALVDRVGADGALQAIEALDRTLALLRGNVNRRLAFEILMLDLPRI
jgi:DNA polymerase-3 subunit delta'